MPEWQDANWLAGQQWPTFPDALHRLHRPLCEDDIRPGSPARRRLAYDELLASQVALGLVRRGEHRDDGRRIVGNGRLHRAVLDALPFRLTAAQRQALAEITADLARPERMLRLLQGDVGSGKTVVALLAMLAAVEAGGQAALMAPTEVLARQHHQTLTRLLAPVNLAPALLTGRERGAARGRILARSRTATARIAVGTHALFQDDVGFKDLALAIVDEQHRFGVQQRLELTAKGRSTDLLVMTATPIPRTLVLALYGDMGISELREKPPGPNSDPNPRHAARAPWRDYRRHPARPRPRRADLLGMPFDRRRRRRGGRRRAAARVAARPLRQRGWPGPWPDGGRG